MSPLTDLLDDLFDGKQTPFYAEFERWARDSRRFKTFATDNRGKIRAKLRYANGDDGLRDVRAELAVAYLLLTEPRFTLEFERYAAAKQRGPDFTVTYKTHTPFNVEVRRLRGGELDDDPGTRREKLMAVLCDKVKQMPPSLINLLCLTSERAVTESDLSQAVTTLRQWAESRNHDYLTRRGFDSGAAFLRQLRRLSGVIVRPAGDNVLWLNPLARHPVPPDLVSALLRSAVAHNNI